MKKNGIVLWSVAGAMGLGLLAGGCAPSAPKGAKRAATVSDVADTNAGRGHPPAGALDAIYSPGVVGGGLRRHPTSGRLAGPCAV